MSPAGLASAVVGAPNPTKSARLALVLEITIASVPGEMPIDMTPASAINMALRTDFDGERVDANAFLLASKRVPPSPSPGRPGENVIVNARTVPDSDNFHIFSRLAN